MTRYLVAQRTTIAPIVALLLMFVVWEAVARLGRIPEYLLPTPSSVFEYTFGNFGLFIPHAWSTIQSTLLGFAFSVVFGIGLSMLIVWSRTFEDAVYPLVVMTQVIPKVAIAPLLIVYLGFGQEPKIFLAFLISFFPMVINTTLGMKSVSTELLDLLTTLKATKWQVMRKVRLMRAIPFIVDGAKISITLAVIGAIVGEFASGNLGLGYLIASASSSLNTVLGFSALLVLTVIGIVLFEVIHLGGRLLTPWTARSAE
jgi:NitT/TauT family transport system permease protein